MIRQSPIDPVMPVHAAQPSGGFLDVAPEPIGEMPGWNLSDLYPEGRPQLDADVEKAARAAAEFRETYLGKLEGLARQDPPALAKAIAAYEAQSDRMGRVGSFAYLNYVTNTADPARAKLFGDAQDRLTTISTQLSVFRAGIEPHRRRGHGRGASERGACALPALAHGLAERAALPAFRRSRKAFP